MKKPKILFLSYDFPRAGSGLGIRTLHLLRSLSLCGNVTLVCRTQGNESPYDLRTVQRLCSEYIAVPDASFKWRSPVYRLLSSRNRYLRAVPLLLSRKPIFTNWNTCVKNKCRPLTAYLKSVDWSEYDVLHVSRLMMADTIEETLAHIKQSGVYTALDLDDIESVAVSRSLEVGSFRPRTRVGRYLHDRDLRRLERHERDTTLLFDACIVCSRVDEEKVRKMGLSNNPWVIPNGVDTQYFQGGEIGEESPREILFLGNMSYGPNTDAVRYFVERIFPRITKQLPEARFVVVGKNAAECVPKEYERNGIKVISNVPDTRNYYAKASLVVAPIRFGGGTRIKILEAMAMKKAVVSTSIGLEGIEATDGKETLLADNEEDFARDCVYLLENPRVRKGIGENARRLVCSKYDLAVIDGIIQRYYVSAWHNR